MSVEKLFRPGWFGLAVCGLVISCGIVRSESISFSNYLAQATLEERHGDISAALKIYGDAEKTESKNAENLCALARRCCNLTYLTNDEATQKDLVRRALDCSLKAVRADSNNATAHASVAVCYARSCAFADIKTQLAYSKLFKTEAERAIALDPNQDIAYYLLGRWNYEIARVGLFSRAFVRVVYGGLPKASYTEAIANFKKAIELAPGRILYHDGLAMAYEATGQKKPELEELKRCGSLTPSGPEDADAQRNAEKKLERLK